MLLFGMRSLRSAFAAAAVTTLSACPDSDDVVDPGPNTTPANAVIVSGNDQTGTVNAQLADPLVVRIRNSANQALQGVVVAWTATVGGGTLANATSTTNSAGEASNTYTLGPDPVTNSVTAAVQANPSINATFTATAIDPTPAGIEIVSGNDQTGATNSELAEPLVVRVQNAASQNLSGILVAWSVAQGGGSLGSPTSTTDAEGEASNTYTLGPDEEENTIVAAIESNPGINATFTATAAAVPSSATVDVVDIEFVPDAVTIALNGTVTWEWGGSLEHNVTWDVAGPANSDTQTSGEFQRTFGSAGTFGYHCTIHGTPGSGMHGSVTVVP